MPKCSRRFTSIVCQSSSNRSYIVVEKGIESTTESERRSGSWARVTAEVIAEGEDESRFERIRQLTHDNAPCYTIKRLKGRHPLNGPWCIGLRAEVPNKAVRED